MIHINKNSRTPTALQVVQEQIETTLLEKKERFKWETGHYSDPIKQELKALYHNKCAFCEQKLVTYKSSQLFTVEHYRPKSIYWWLGNEWTNLFPTCQKCNDNKEDEFEVRYKPKQITQPVLNTDGSLNRAACTASLLRTEKPVFIHPEVDQPEYYFEFLPTGEVVVKNGLSDWEAHRAKKMLDKFLNRPSLIEKRLTYINTLKDDLERAVKHFSTIIGHKNYDREHLKLAFFPTLEKIFTSAAPELEFSRLGYFISRAATFHTFFLVDYEKEVQTLILQAVELYISA